MAFYKLGAFIRKLREERKMTQAELAEGICHLTTISRIENGIIAPSRDYIERIMQRLGLGVEKFFHAFQSDKEYENYLRREELYQLLRTKNVEQIREKIEELEGDNDFMTCFGRQFLLFAKAELAYSGDADYQMALEHLRSAILITIMRFTETDIKKYLLTFDEIIIIHLMANSYGKLGDSEKAIRILYDLRESIRSSYSDEAEKARTYPMVIHTLTKYLGLIGKHDEVISLCDEGASVCIRKARLEYLPYLLSNKASALFSLGDTDSCKELFTQAYYAIKIKGNHNIAEQLKKRVADEYNIVIA